MSDDLVAFLRARLDEEDAATRSCSGQDWRHIGRGTVVDRDVDGWQSGPDRAVIATVAAERVWGDGGSEDAAHIARHDPARVLREVEAKRRAVEECSYWNEKLAQEAADQPEFPQPGLGLILDAVNPILRALALAYADHPDYREDWRP